MQIDEGTIQSFSNAKGEFYIYDVLPGWHKLQIWDLAYEFTEQVIEVPSSETFDIGTIFISKIAGTVVGRVLDSATSEPLALAWVQLDNNDHWRTITDEEGNFMLIMVAAGQHKLQISCYAYGFQDEIITVDSSGPTDLGDKVCVIIPNTVRGQVVDKITGRPILGAHVQYDGGGEGKETTTTITGHFILTNVPDGDHLLQTWGWAYTFDQRLFTQMNRTTNLGQVSIEPIGDSVNGRVIDAVNGLPIYNAIVQLDSENYVPWSTYSQPNGDFIVYDVNEKTHQFQTWGYAYRFIEFGIDCISGNNKHLGDISLMPDPNTFNGRVLDAQTRQPIGGATVILTGNGQYQKFISFPDGRFVLIKIPQGIYDITVEGDENPLIHFKAMHPGNNIAVDVGDVLLPRNWLLP